MATTAAAQEDDRSTVQKLRNCWLLSDVLPLPAGAADLAGQASVIDADTIEIHDQRIRLYGVDAPESGQMCKADGKKYRCGMQAALVLADFLVNRTVICDQRDIDRYGRIVAVCTAGGQDLGAWLVTNGQALAFRRYSLDCVDEEQAAEAAKRGMWRGEFVPPWEWRKGKR